MYLPKICVIGAQGSGKSTVLEAITGLTIFPRGNGGGITTRVPVEVKLVHYPSAKEPWVIFADDGDRQISDLRLVQERITLLHNDVARGQRTPNPIILTFYSDHCPDLTLVDLPELTRLPAVGTAQTDDSKRVQTQSAWHYYVTDCQSILLAVVAANTTDVASDTFHLARDLDPLGVRTIGVLTKVDLVDGYLPHILRHLQDAFPIRLGYIALLTSSSLHLHEPASLHYQNVQSERNIDGIPYGVDTLSDELLNVLLLYGKDSLLRIRRDVWRNVQLLEEGLSRLGPPIPSRSSERKTLLWRMAQDYCDSYRSSLKGSAQKHFPWMSHKEELVGGPAIRNIFTEFLQEFLGKDITVEMSDDYINSALRQYGGCGIPFLDVAEAFRGLIGKQLARLHTPVFDTLERVCVELETFTEKLISYTFGRFPRLAKAATLVSEKLLHDEKAAAYVILEQVIAWQTGFLFTNDPTFLRSVATKPSSVVTATREVWMAERQARFDDNWSVTGMWENSTRLHYPVSVIETTRDLINRYFHVVLKNLRDEIPRAIGSLVIERIGKKQSLSFLHLQMGTREKFRELLTEAPYAAEQRRDLVTRLEVLRGATKALQQDATFRRSMKVKIDETFEADLDFLISNGSSVVSLLAYKRRNDSIPSSVLTAENDTGSDSSDIGLVSLSNPREHLGTPILEIKPVRRKASHLLGAVRYVISAVSELSRSIIWSKQITLSGNESACTSAFDNSDTAENESLNASSHQIISGSQLSRKRPECDRYSEGTEYGIGLRNSKRRKTAHTLRNVVLDQDG